MLRNRRPRKVQPHQQQQQQNECAASWSWRDPEIWIFISMLVIISISLSYLFYVGGFKEDTINGDGSEAVGEQTNVIQPAVTGNGIKDAQQQPPRDEDVPYAKGGDKRTKQNKVEWEYENDHGSDPMFSSYDVERSAEIEEQYLSNKNFYLSSLEDDEYDIYLDPASNGNNFFLQINKKTQNVRKVQRCEVGKECVFSRDGASANKFDERWDAVGGDEGVLFVFDYYLRDLDWAIPTEFDQLRKPEFNANNKNYERTEPFTDRPNIRDPTAHTEWKMTIESVTRCNEVDPGLKQRWTADVANYGPGATPPGELVNFWHGTTTEAAQKIATGGFKMEKEQENLNGHGNYFGTFDYAVWYSFKRKEVVPESPNVAYSSLFLSKIVLPEKKVTANLWNEVAEANNYLKTNDGQGGFMVIVNDDKALPVFNFKLKWTFSSI